MQIVVFLAVADDVDVCLYRNTGMYCPLQTVGLILKHDHNKCQQVSGVIQVGVTCPSQVCHAFV